MTDQPPTVFQAWAAVMAEIQAVRKSERNTTPGQNFMFRGIEQVMNAVGPALRAHQVMVIPTSASIDTERYATDKGKQMQGVILKVTLTVYGPAGDSFTGEVYGQAADTGDKAVTKAHSVALRTFLTQALMIPTDDPDPDTESHHRSGAPHPIDEPHDPLKQAKDAVWDATTRHIEPGVDPGSGPGQAQRQAVLRDVMKEIGTSPMQATEDDLRRAYKILTTGEETSPSMDDPRHRGEPEHPPTGN